MIILGKATMKVIVKGRRRQEKMIKRFEKLIEKSFNEHGSSTPAIIEMALERKHVVLPKVAFLERRISAETRERDLLFLRFQSETETLKDHIKLRREAVEGRR